MYVTYVSSCVYNMHIVLCNEVKSGVHVCYTYVSIWHVCYTYVCTHTYSNMHSMCVDRERETVTYIFFTCVYRDCFMVFINVYM